MGYHNDKELHAAVSEIVYDISRTVDEINRALNRLRKKTNGTYSFHLVESEHLSDFSLVLCEADAPYPAMIASKKNIT